MLSLLNVEECELLGDSKYRAYCSQVEKALKAFEATSEWADLISALGKLNKVLTNHVKYPVIPKRVTIGKRLAQCLHPALPSGVHLKALETYDIIFKCIGTQRLASDLFTYSAGLFPLLGYAALNVRPVLLSLYEKHFVPLGHHIKPGLTGLLLGLLPGLEEGSEHFDRTTRLMGEFCESVGKEFFYGCLWECVMASPAVRLQAVSYVLSQFNRKQTMEDQLFFMGTNIDILIQSLCSSLQDSSVLVQRAALEMLLIGFPLHNNQLTSPDKIKLLTAAIKVVLRRDMSLNRRLYAWLLGTDSNGVPLQVKKPEDSAAVSQTPTPKTQRQDSSGTLAEETDMSYFRCYSSYPLYSGIINCIWETASGETFIDGKQANLRPFRILISLLDKPEIGMEIIEDVLVDLFRFMYLEYQKLSTECDNNSLTRNCSSTSFKLGKRNGRSTLTDSANQSTELIKTANLLFGSFETSYLWDYFGWIFQVAISGSKCDDFEENGSPVSSSGTLLYPELCFLISFLLDKVTLETYPETQTVHLPELLHKIIKILDDKYCELKDEDIFTGLSLCAKILSKILPSMRPVSIPDCPDSQSISDGIVIEPNDGDDTTSNEGYLSAESEVELEKSHNLSVQERLRGDQSMKRAESFGSFKEFHCDSPSGHPRASPQTSPKKEAQPDAPQTLMQKCLIGFQKLFCHVVRAHVVNLTHPVIKDLMGQLSVSVSSSTLEKTLIQKNGQNGQSPEVSTVRVMYDRDSKVKNQHEVTALTLSTLTPVMCQAFSLACQLLVDLSCFPMYCTDQMSKLLKKLNKKGESTKLPDWMNMLIICACFVTKFEIQSTAISTILDLVGVMQPPSHGNKEYSSDDEDEADEAEGSKWTEESLNTVVRTAAPAENTVTVVIIPPLTTDQLCYLDQKTRFYQIVCGHLWNYLGEECAVQHQRGVELLNLLHQLTPNPWICENVIGNSLLNEDSRICLDAHKKFAVLWHLLREQRDHTRPGKSSRTFDRSMFLMLDSLQSDVNPCRALTQTWLTHSIQRADIARILEPIIILLLHPDTARVSIQHVCIHKPKKVRMSEDLAADEEETKIYAISSEGGNIIYHVSKTNKPFMKKSSQPSRSYALTTYSETGMATRHGPKADDVAFERVNPKDVKLRFNPFGSSNSLDGEPVNNMVNFQQAKRLTKETCKNEGIDFNDIDDAEEAVEPPNEEKTDAKKKKGAASNSKGNAKQTKQKTTTKEKSPVLKNDTPVVEQAVEATEETEKAESVKSGKSNEDVGETETYETVSSVEPTEEAEEDIMKIVGILLDEMVEQIELDVKYEPPIVLHGSLSYMDSLDSGNDSLQDQRGMSPTRETGADEVFCNLSPTTKVHLHLDSEDEEGEAGENENKEDDEAPEVHPLHAHILLYSQRYDAQRTLYGLTCLKAILTSAPRLIACAISTTSVSTSNTSNMTQLQHLLARHRRSVFGKNFYGEVPPDVISSYRSIMYVEVLISVSLYYIRSYYPNLMMSTLKEQELNGNKEVQILSCEILAMLLSELVSVARESGKGFSTYISDLLSRCKVQKALMHCLLASVYNNRQRSKSDSGNITEAIISFNEENMDANTNETFQIKLLRLIVVLILLEDQTRKYNAEDITVQGAEPDRGLRTSQPSRLSTHSALPSSPMFKYIHTNPIVQQNMLLSAVLSALRQQHMCHLHRHWINMVTSALPYMGRALSQVVVAVVNQLCVNIEFLAFLYEKGVPKRGSPSLEKIPVDHLITLLEGLTTLSHYCLLDNAQQDISVGHTFPANVNMSGDPAGTAPIIGNLIHVFSPYSGSREPSPAKDNSNVMSPVTEARRHLLSHLPRILSSLTILWKAATTSEADHEKARSKPAWWTMGQPKFVRQQILELVSPVARHHGVNMLAAVAVVWNDRRVRDASKRVQQVIPKACEDQLLLVELVSAIKVLPTDTLIQTIKQVMKSPPPTSQDRHRSATTEEKRTPLEVSMVQFFYSYVQRISGGHLIDSWPSLLALFKEGLQLNLSPSAVFLLLGILNEFILKVPMFEERKDQKDLQDITQKLLEACSEIAGASLEQTTWLRRNLAVKPGPQMDLLEHEEALDAENDDGTPPPSQAENKSYRQYSVQALIMLAELIASLLDVIYSSDEKEKVVPFLNSTMHHVFPYLRNHSPHNLPSFRACSQMLASMSSYQYTRKAWRREAFDLLLDSSFFQMDDECFGYWCTIIDNLMTHDKVTFKDLLARVIVTPSGSLSLFSSREQEFEQKAQLLKRLSFTLFCSEVDQYQRYMPDIQERLADSLRMSSVPSIQAQVFLCFRVLILRMSPQHLVSLWPTIITELVHVLLQFEQDLIPDADEMTSQLARLANMDSTWALGNGVSGHQHPSFLQLYLAACKLLDMALVLPTDALPQFQLYRWAFTGDPGVDLDSLELDNQTMKQLKESQPGFLPHVFRINRLMNLRFGTVIPKERVTGQLLLRSAHIRSVRDLHLFFATVANSAQSVDSFTCDQTLKQNQEGGIPKSKSLPADLSADVVTTSPLKLPASQRSARMNIEKMIEADFLENMPRK